MIKTTMQVLFHGIGHYTPTKVIGPSEWAHHDIILAYSGSVYMEAGGGHFHMDRGDVLVIPPHNPFVGRGVSDLARKAELSESHFRMKFRDSYGISPAEALRQLRIREAQRLLITTNLPIKEISSMVGYGDVVAFHRAFQRTGQTPAQYRAAHWSGV